MHSRLGLPTLILLGATAFFLFSRTNNMSSNPEQPDVVQEGATPQQQEQQKPELAPRVASSGPRSPLPLLTREDLVKAQENTGGRRIGRPVEPPVDS